MNPKYVLEWYGPTVEVIIENFIDSIQTIITQYLKNNFFYQLIFL